MGFSIGLARAGWLGGVAAWCGFTLPSALLMIAFAALAPDLGGPVGTGLVHGLKLAAVAVVAQAVWDMSRRLCTDTRRAFIALFAIALSAALHSVYAQLAVIASGAVAGFVLCRTPGSGLREARSLESVPAHSTAAGAATASLTRVSHAAGITALAVFGLLLFGLPAWLRASPSGASAAGSALHVFDAFYRAGALVFGGGHVVLPLLQQQPAIAGAVSANAFLAGYGAAQAVPGPLFTFAAYLGWTMQAASSRLFGAALATIGIFMPGLLLVIAALPHWQALRRHPSAAAMLAGVNAAVVGLLASALYSPVWTSAVASPLDFAVAAIAFVALVRLKWPPLAVVAFCAAAGLAHGLLPA